MARIRVTKEFGFEMAHALWNYDGKCSNMHGHSYKLFVTVSGEVIEDPNNKKLGMVIDFGDLKSIVKTYIVDRFDHSCLINKSAPADKFKEIDQMFDKMERMDYQPTCENMVVHFAEIIKEKLPAGVVLISVKLYETANSCAEWLQADNAD